MAWGTFSQVLTIAVSLLIAVGGWIWNDFSKRNSEERQRKEERYTALLASTKGFYQNADRNEAIELKNEFIRQLELCWLYCPDTVIRKGYAFLETVHTGARRTDEEKERALGEFILEIRKDLFGKRFLFWGRTSLVWSDFRILTGT